MTDQDYMALALDLAQKGAGWTSPNPMVGAVLVKQGRIIGQGYHARWGDLHAERAALAACREDPAGSTLYVTLEPCCHQGKQPPCTQAILEAGITRRVRLYWPFCQMVHRCPCKINFSRRPARAWPSFGPRGSR